MKVEQGQAAFITRSGSGIGRALALALASRGVHVTILDLETPQGEETVRLVEEEHARISYKPSSPSAIFIQCDVTKSDELAAAYAATKMSSGGFTYVSTAPVLYWVIQDMKEQGGLVLNMCSAYGFVPTSIKPIYATSKAGVAMFTRSLAHVGMGIRVNALCPEFVDTPILSGVPSFLKDIIRDKVGYIKMENVVAAAFSVLDDESEVGECLWVPSNGPTQVWPDEETKSKYQIFMKDGSVFTGVFN